MSEPQATQGGDPTAVILARMEVKLDNALTEQSRHSSTLDRHDAQLNEHGNRLVALETARSGDSENQARSYTGKAVMWTALGSICAAAAVLMAVLLAVRGGAA